MPPAPGTLRVSRYFTALGLILAVLYMLVFLPGNANTPKLGIDLVGGIRVIFTAKPPPGEAVTQNSMSQARQIIEDRINGTGVTASTVQIQGTDQLVVSIPGGTDTDVARLGAAAQLNFRPVIAPVVGVACNPSKKPTSGLPTGSASASAGAGGSSASAPASSAPSGAKASSSASPAGAIDPAKVPDLAPVAAAPTSASRSVATSAGGSASSTPSSSVSPAGSGTAVTTPASGSASPSGAASSSAAPAAPACVTSPAAALKAVDPALAKLPTTEDAYGKLTSTQQQEVQAALAYTDCAAAANQPDNRTEAYIACEQQGGQQIAYLLGKVIVPGTQIKSADAVAPSTSGQGGSTQWTVSLTLKGAGQDAWAKWTTKYNTGQAQTASPQSCGTGQAFPCSVFVAFTLDGQVISAPATNEAIVGQATQVSGNFTQKSANDLANQLKYGALPLTFRTDSNERVSASLGTSQLNSALLAGGIGLVLVVLYSLLYYRALGLVTISSLLVSGLLTYAMMVVLGQQIGFTLDLSGIAGLIVALGITADSFVVFFERIKDEVHDGRSVRVAVPRAWVRARRTVLSADTVSFLAAAILYYFASADVKGFAFTLGLSTILDLVVVFLFTHPVVSLLSRSRAFGSARFTGLSNVRAGGITVERDGPRGKLAGASRRTPTAGRGRTAVLDRPQRTADLDAFEDEPVRDGYGSETVGDVDGDAADLGGATERTGGRVDPDDGVTVEPPGDRPVQETDAAGDDADEVGDQPRRRTTPGGGTAAERAAARRARLKQQRDADEGKS